MSKKINPKREAYKKKQEEQGRKVVNWIFGVLIAFAVFYLFVSKNGLVFWAPPLVGFFLIS